MFNEKKTLAPLLQKILTVPLEAAGFESEIIVVDDGSTDGSSEETQAFPTITCLRLEKNQGKGNAVRRGIENTSGDFVLVQDGDLEYDPEDYLPMLQALSGAHDQTRTAIYGSRTLGQWEKFGWTVFPGRHPQQAFGPWLAGVVLSAWTFLLYRQWISDTLTAYKIYPRDVIGAMTTQTRGFETDHEITAKLIRAGIRITEVPIRYEPRTTEMGKKIRARDGAIAIWTLLRFRFSR